MPRPLRAWRALLSLSWPERRLLARAWLMLPAVAISLPVFGFKRVQSLLIGPEGVSAEEADAGRARSAARLVDTAACWHPVPATCLVRSLVLCHVLRRLGLAASLQIGVALPDGTFEAHAWVEHNGIALAQAGAAAARYTPFARPASRGSA